MKKFQIALSFVRKYEFLLFIAAVAVLSGEVFANQWQVTEDGAAHIYNSIVARELYFHPETALGTVFELNSTPVPNALGHLLLSFLTAYLPLDIADKILHLIIVLGMCFSFRFLVKQINPEQVFYSWLIFPFVYSGIFYLGFYNFELGVVLFLLSSAIWLRFENRNARIGMIILLSVLCTILFLSHLIPFLLFVLVAGSRILIRFSRKDLRLFFKSALELFLIILPALVLFIKYFTSRTEITASTFWANPIFTFKRMLSLRHLSVHTPDGNPIAVFLSITLLLALMLVVYFYFRRRKTISKTDSANFKFWGGWWIFIFALLFIAPDDFGGSGALTSRLIEFSLFFLLLFLVAGKLPSAFVSALAVISLSVSVLMIHVRKASMIELNAFPQKVMRFSDAIETNSTGVYIPLTGNWLKQHIGELVFAEKKSFLLSNYETFHDFFMVKWKKDFSFNYTIGGLRSSDLPCSSCYWPAKPDKSEKHIDYVLICKEHIQDSACYVRMNDSLEKYYVLKKTEDPFYLYQSKQSMDQKNK